MFTVKVRDIKVGPRWSEFVVRRGVAVKVTFFHDSELKQASINRVFDAFWRGQTKTKIEAIQKSQPTEIRVFPKRVQEYRGFRTDYYVHGADLDAWSHRAFSILRSTGQ